MDCSRSGLSVHHQLLEFTQTHVHWGSDAIQPCHPLSFPSPPAFKPSQHQGLFQSVLHIRWSKYWSFSFNISPSNEHSGLISFRMDWLDLLEFKGLSRVFSNTTGQKHQFFPAQLSLWSTSHIHTWLLEKPYLWLDRPLLAKLFIRNPANRSYGPNFNKLGFISASWQRKERRETMRWEPKY